MKLHPLRNPLATAAACTLALASCVNVDPNTNETIPRGQQRYEFDEVTENAERLEEGMTKLDVLTLLGSPAEKDKRGDVWIYLPERAAVIVPGRALRLEFRYNLLVDHGYNPIILGKRF
jgi:outer membrane protein assembly factor BamE (lipoprotein component of BamABCDE complex)